MLEKRSAQRRWLNFKDTFLNGNYNPVLKHFKNKDNKLANFLSRQVEILLKE